MFSRTRRTRRLALSLMLRIVCNRIIDWRGDRSWAGGGNETVSQPPWSLWDRYFNAPQSSAEGFRFAQSNGFVFYHRRQVSQCISSVSELSCYVNINDIYSCIIVCCLFCYHYPANALYLTTFPTNGPLAVISLALPTLRFLAAERFRLFASLFLRPSTVLSAFLCFASIRDKEKAISRKKIM